MMKIRWLVFRLTLLLGPLAPAVSGAAADTAATPKAESPALFENIPPEVSGLKFVHRLDSDAAQAYLYSSPYPCGGVALGDVDGNGTCDIFLANGVDDNALFLNRGALKFEKIPCL